jgi:hypothetical protein
MCDRLAAHPLDRDRVVDAVSYEILLTQTAEAVAACRSAVEEHPGVARFEFQLGRALAAEASNEEAVKWYRAAAERDHTAAQFNLALSYSSGIGIERDLGLANFWYRRAADQNYSYAMWNLAINLNEGTGGPHDPVGAAEYLIKAYLAGHAKAERAFSQNLDSWQVGTRREVQRLLQIAGHYDGPVNGEIDAATVRALQRYAAAETGVEPQDTDTADTAPDAATPDTVPIVSQKVGLQECDSLAAHNADTQRVTSAVSYTALKGHNAEAIAACRKATAAFPGVLRFEFQLARALAASGESEEAIVWYLKAAEREYTAAMFNLAIAYDDGTGTAKDQAEANRWYRKAAENGRADAMWNLAINLDQALGGPADPVHSARFLLAAFRVGHEPTSNAFGKSLTAFKTATRQEIQKLLREAGHYTGDIDGDINEATLRAAEAYREAS